MPVVAILALQGDTKIVIYVDNKKRIINIPEGHLFLMSGDVVHGGYCFTTVNARIHFYMETNDLFTSDRNKTGWVLWDGTQYIPHPDSEWQPE